MPHTPPIRRDRLVTALGSCFADEIRIWLRDRGFRVNDDFRAGSSYPHVEDSTVPLWLGSGLGEDSTVPLWLGSGLGAATVCYAHAMHMPCTCHAHAMHMLCTCCAHAVHVLCTCYVTCSMCMCMCMHMCMHMCVCMCMHMCMCMCIYACMCMRMPRRAQQRSLTLQAAPPRHQPHATSPTPPAPRHQPYRPMSMSMCLQPVRKHPTPDQVPLLQCSAGLVNTFVLLQQFRWAFEGRRFSDDLWVGASYP